MDQQGFFKLFALFLCSCTQVHYVIMGHVGFITCSSHSRRVVHVCAANIVSLPPSPLSVPALDQLFPSIPPSLVPFFPSALLLYFKARRSREGEGSERFTAGGVVLEGGKNNSLFIHFLCPLLTSTPRSSLSPAPLLLLQCLTLLTFFADSLRNHRAGLIRCIRHRS